MMTRPIWRRIRWKQKGGDFSFQGLSKTTHSAHWCTSKRRFIAWRVEQDESIH